MDKLKFAIAGRSKERLEEVKKKWCKIDPKLADLEILVVNLDKDSEVINLVKNTKVILSSAGPFFLTGTKLVAQCAAYGTDYCDITGEVAWVRQMIEKYDNIAA